MARICAVAVAHPADDHRHHRQDERRQELIADSAGQDRPQHVGAQMTVVVGRVRRGEEGLAGGDPRRDEPADRLHGQPGEEDQAHGRAAEGRLAKPEPDRVEPEEGPPLGPDQAAGGHDQIGLQMAAVEQAVDDPDRDGDEDRLRGPVQEVVVPSLVMAPGEHDPDRRQQPREGAEPSAAGQSAGELPRAPQRQQAADPGRDHPQRRGRAAEQAVDRGEDHRQRLPRRAPVDDEAGVRVKDLVSPDDPRPRVIAGDRGQDGRRQSRQRHAGEHPQHHRRARGAAQGIGQ